MVPHLVVQWPRLGPYHVARLRAADALCRARGGRLTALETAAQDTTYAWDEEADVSFERVQALPGRSLSDVSAREVFSSVARTLDRLAPDAVAVNSYSGFDAQAALLWCRSNGRAAILMSDSKADDSPRRRWKEAFKRRIIDQFDAGLIAGSRSRAYYGNLGLPDAALFEPYDVVGPSVDGPAAVSLDEKPFFLTVARLIALKNLDRLLRAYAAYVRTVDAPWRLTVVGDGPERDQLETLKSRLLLDDYVSFPGFLQHDAIARHYRSARALIHPSLKDTWGLVVNEAMAHGLPVAVSEQSGCVPDIVRDGENGLVFDAESEETLTQALVRLHKLGDASRLAWGDASRRIIGDYTPDHFASALWDAAAHGLSQPNLNRGVDPIMRTAFAALRWTARTSEPFQDV